MTETLVRVERSGAVVVLTMDRPGKRNAMTQAMAEQLVGACREVAADDSVGAVVLTGAGGAFSGGLDLAELRAGSIHVEGGIMQAVRDVPQPTIAAISGPAVTGGLELALSCDIRLGDGTAVLADTHAHVGVLPAGGMTVLLPRVVGAARALEMSLSARKVGAAEAERWGLLNRVVEGDVLVEAVALAERIAAAGPTGRALVDLVRAELDLPLADALAHDRTAGLASMRDFAERDQLSGERP